MLDTKLGRAQRHRELKLFPIIALNPAPLPYRLMAEALADRTLLITEVGSGSVPVLRAVNGGEAPILVLDGEQLIGAKQNRMTNRSLLLPGRSETNVPVSCMEHGRWHFASDDFESAPQHAPSKVRKHARRAEARAAVDRPSPEAACRVRAQDELSAAQGPVWDEIRKYSHSLGGQSSTGALDSLYRHRGEEIDHWIRRFPVRDGQIGILAYLGEETLGLDVVGDPALYERFHQRILRGYIMDAMEGMDSAEGAAGKGAAKNFLELVRDAERLPAPPVGLGEYRVLNGKILGGELEEAGRLVHLSAFPAEVNGLSGTGNGAPYHGSPIARPSQRGRGRQR